MEMEELLDDVKDEATGAVLRAKGGIVVSHYVPPEDVERYRIIAKEPFQAGPGKPRVRRGEDDRKDFVRGQMMQLFIDAMNLALKAHGKTDEEIDEKAAKDAKLKDEEKEDVLAEAEKLKAGRLVTKGNI